MYKRQAVDGTAETSGFADNIVPVSYTHLDVYKRQPDTKEKCEQTKQETHQIREENKEEIPRVCTDIGERMEGVYKNMNNIDNQVSNNKEKIVEICRRELQLQEEVGSWRDRPCHSTHTSLSLIHI